MVKLKRRLHMPKTNYDAMNTRLDGESALAQWRKSSMLSPGSKGILDKYEKLQRGFMGMDSEGKRKKGRSRRRSRGRKSRSRSRGKSHRRKSGSRRHRRSKKL